ncbi:COMM domain-containing protein 5-like [Ornithodoros turicata]|uniref:COMM domain-containing protein 5 n=1 Tax=Ornithodoros turicata TaxID=34597 RepID=A0A2R5LB97_9ACAR
MAALVGGVTEKTLFLGPAIPKNIKALPKLLTTIDKQAFRNLVKLAVADFEGKEVQPDAYQNIRSGAIDACGVDAIYSGLYTLLHTALRIPASVLKQEAFKEDLQALHIPEEFIEDLVSVVYGTRRSHIDQNNIESAPGLPTLENLKWRLDVTISNNVLNRVLEPTILMEMDTSDGKKHTFEVQRAEFHKLRHSVAAALKEMEDIERKLEKIPGHVL